MTDSSIRQPAETRRVPSTSHSKFLHFLAGHCGMEIAVLLLLTVSLTAASPLRSDKDIVLPGASVQAVEEERSEGTQQQRASSPKIVPFHAEDEQFDMDALKLRLAAKLRTRRAPHRGCHLGTCQVNNLANDLHEISKSEGKDNSKDHSKFMGGFGR